jgi:small multidrug resistance family-3 protein
MAVASYVLLLLAAALEVGGDALIRVGLQSHQTGARLALFLAGGFVLLAYGLTVNAPSWDFGRLLGVYVTLFFVIAQLVNWSLFGARPGPPIVIGGLLIFSGGLVITFWPA